MNNVLRSHFYVTQSGRIVQATGTMSAFLCRWGSNDSQLGFISKHMGSALERDLITPEQRAEAIAAATGQRSTACRITRTGC
jgi:hypothetical protein